MNNFRTKIDFGFGVQIKADGSLLTHEERVIGLARIRRSAVTEFGGCTLYRTDGDWLDSDSGTLYSEQGATLSILVEEGPSVNTQQSVLRIAGVIKAQLNQKAVYVTRCPVQSELY